MSLTSWSSRPMMKFRGPVSSPRPLDRLPEPHNPDDGWQGRFRRGHPDGVLLAHAARACGRLDGLLVGHLDALGAGLRWCSGYRGGNALPPLAPEALTAWLQRAEPVYEPGVPTRGELLARLQQAVGAPLRAWSDGPTHADVQGLAPD